MKHSMLCTISLIAVLAFLPLPAVKAAPQDDHHGSHQGDWRDDDDKDWHDRDNDKAPVSVTVSFGAGINTALAPRAPNVPPTPIANEENDHIIPKRIEVKAGGVVNFVVAGFHQIFAYNPGVKREDVEGAAPTFDPMGDPQSFFINYGLRPQDDPSILLYVGVNPGGGLPFPPANALTPPSPFPIFANTFNRVESIMFPEPGRYLVICNVTPHFNAGMWAWVKVSK
jgi:hypothetical protein